MTVPAPPAIAQRGLQDADWAHLRCFTRAEVADHCQGRAWENIDAGSLFLLDQFAGYVTGDKRLVERVQFMPTRQAGSGIPTATWNERDTRAHAADSMHYRGRAFDLMFPKNALATAWLVAVQQPRWGGIGAYPFWRPDPGLHLDTRWVGDTEEGRGFRVFWWVDQAGKYRYLSSEAEILEFLDVLRRAA